MAKRQNYLTYKNNFQRIVERKIEVVGCKYDKEVSEIVTNVEDFRQCYKKGDKVREQLPRYWFLSKEGFLISVRNPDAPKWVSPNLNAKRPLFKISKYKKNITVYTLVSLVWDSYRTKNAQTILNEKGLRGVGRLELDKCGRHVWKVQAHHIKNYIQGGSLEDYIANNDPENLQLVTVREHDVLNKLQEGNTDSMIFYQPRFMNVPDSDVVAFDIENAKMLDLNRVDVVKIVSFSFMPNEKDSIVTDDYIFVSKDNRAFLENNKELLEHLAESHPPKYDDIRDNFFEIYGNTVFYQKK